MPMDILYRKISQNDTDEVLNMMRVFYVSDALYTNGSEDIFRANIENALCGSKYLEGYVILQNQTIIGYAMLAKSFSTEFGRECIWLEDLYIKEGYRGRGIISGFIQFVKNEHQNKILRLEVEWENKGAIKAYEKAGFKTLPYSQFYYLKD